MNLTELLSIDEINFLKDFAHKRKIQSKDGCAEPVFWMIQDQKNSFTEDGEYLMFFGDGEELYNTYNNFDKDKLEELKEYIIDNTDITTDEVEELKEIHDNDSLLDFIEWNDLDINYRRFTREYFISTMTGAFLTKEAAKKHLKENDYHYSKNARTYGMVGWRNYELEKLVSIIEKFDNIEMGIDNEKV